MLLSVYTNMLPEIESYFSSPVWPSPIPFGACEKVASELRLCMLGTLARKLSDGKMLLRTLPTSILQIFRKIILHSKVIF